MPAVVRAVIKAKGGQDKYQNTFILYITICNQSNNCVIFKTNAKEMDLVFDFGPYCFFYVIESNCKKKSHQLYNKCLNKNP